MSTQGHPPPSRRRERNAGSTYLGAVSSWTALEGIKFLFSQASEVIKAWREREQSSLDQTPDGTELQVPILDNEILDGAVEPQTVDPAVVEQQYKTLLKLLGSLTPYASGLADIYPSDDAQMSQAAQVRAILEAAYGQRLTFNGERRASTGSQVSVVQILEGIAGQVVEVAAQV